jgi:uncharacterized protein
MSERTPVRVDERLPGGRGSDETLHETIPIRFLTLLLTSRCNLRCRYCYVSEGRQGQPMTVEIARRAIDVFARGPSNERLTIELAGGEPLLNWEVLTQVVEYAQSTCPAIRFALQTNGLLLDAPKIEFLVDHGVGIAVSLDGVPAINDAQRGGSQRVLRALRLVSDSKAGVNVTAVLTRHSIERLPDLLLLCGSLSCVRVVNLDILRPLGTNGWEMVPSKTQIAQTVDVVPDVLAYINARRFPPLKVREFDRMVLRREDGVERPYCHAAQGLAAAVTPDGSLYPCASLVGIEGYQAGTIWQPVPSGLNTLADQVGSRGLYPQECTACELRAICRGGCPSRRIAYTGSAANRCELECYLYKEIYQRMRVNDQDRLV